MAKKKAKRAKGPPKGPPVSLVLDPKVNEMCWWWLWMERTLKPHKLKPHKTTKAQIEHDYAILWLHGEALEKIGERVVELYRKQQQERA